MPVVSGRAIREAAEQVLLVQEPALPAVQAMVVMETALVILIATVGVEVDGMETMDIEGR